MHAPMSAFDPKRTSVQSRRSSAAVRSNVEVVWIMTIVFRFAAVNLDHSQCRDFLFAIRGKIEVLRTSASFDE
jgi:hypothetical protein